jgi:hypothetical protein
VTGRRDSGSGDGGILGWLVTIYETMACGRHCDCRSLEATMGNKDKGGKNTKSVATKNLKEKRLDKKAKRTAADTKRNGTV